MGDMTEAAITVRKYGARIPVSRSELVWSGKVKPTEAERREMEAWRVQYDQRKAAATQAWPVFVAALAAVTDPVGRAVLDLHKNRDGECNGCEFTGYEAESPNWPCDTTTTVAKALGIDVPEDLDIAEQARQW